MIPANWACGGPVIARMPGPLLPPRFGDRSGVQPLLTGRGGTVIFATASVETPVASTAPPLPPRLGSARAPPVVRSQPVPSPSRAGSRWETSWEHTRDMGIRVSDPSTGFGLCMNGGVLQPREQDGLYSGGVGGHQQIGLEGLYLDSWVQQQHVEAQRPDSDIIIHLCAELENAQDELKKKQKCLEHVKYLLDDKEVEMQRVNAVNRERIVVPESEFEEADIVAKEREVQLTSQVKKANQEYRQLQKELDMMKVERDKAEEDANIKKELAALNGEKLEKFEEITTDIMNQLTKEKINHLRRPILKYAEDFVKI